MDGCEIALPPDIARLGLGEPIENVAAPVYAREGINETALLPKD